MASVPLNHCHCNISDGQIRRRPPRALVEHVRFLSDNVIHCESEPYPFKLRCNSSHTATSKITALALLSICFVLFIVSLLLYFKRKKDKQKIDELERKLKDAEKSMTEGKHNADVESKNDYKYTQFP